MQNQLKNDTFIRALLRQPTDYTPIWLMRQAGRYLPEYKATRQRAGNFLNLCKSPNLACEVTIQPVDRFDLDAAILFSDILTIPDAMGLGLYFAENEGPKFEHPLQDEQQINNLQIADMDKLAYVPAAVSEIKKSLNNKIPLIGFSGSPFTLACYMVEGGGSKEFSKIKKMLYLRPNLLHKILQTLADSVVNYLNAQIESGVNAVMIFDTWGGTLTPTAYQEFSLNYMQYIIKNLTPNIPSIIFTKGGGLWLENMANINCNAIGVDWTINIAEAKRRIGDKVAIQGNLDPSILLSNAKVVNIQTKKLLDDFYAVDNNANGHIFNLGHGISQFADPENVKELVQTVHNYSKQLRQK
ncbi:MAG: uroporphyrinogen decarboxylase [Rhodocyclaceae bacterium]